MPLNGKVALITGGSRGIGAEIARQLSAEGARIFLAANDSDDMFETVVRQCREQSAAGEVTYGRFDFLEEGSSSGVVPAVMSALWQQSVTLGALNCATKYFGAGGIAKGSTWSSCSRIPQLASRRAGEPPGGTRSPGAGCTAR